MSRSLALSSRLPHAPRLRARAWTPRTLLVAGLLAAVALGGIALRADRAANPLPASSSDEHSYLIIARSIARHNSYVAEKNPWHWPPGTPLLFAAAEKVSGGHGLAPRSVYAVQALVSVLAIFAAFAAAALLAGAWAGVAAAAATAFYPPLFDAAGRALSEPLGGLGVVLSLLATIWALRRPSRRRFALAGVLFGLTLLVRTDLAPAVPVVALVVWLALRRSRRRDAAATAADDPRAPLRCGAVLLVAAVLTVLPWTALASIGAHRFVPISNGGTSALYIGTYLPGEGSIFGLKRALGDDLRLQEPRYGHVPNHRIGQSFLLAMVAARHPGVSHDTALRQEAFHNIAHYGTTAPGRFLRMLGAKAARMWTTPTRNGQGARLSARSEAVHVALVALAILGTLLGAALLRGRGLGVMVAVALVSTVVNAIFLSEPRHLLPLAPALFATGAAGLAAALRGRLRGRAARVPADAT